MASPEARQILIKDFGYQPVDIESKSGYSRAIKETVNKLKLENPKDPRIKTLQDAVRPSRKRTTKKESTKKESTQPKKTKDDAVKFIRGRGTPEPVEPTPQPMPKFGGAKTGAALTSISQTVNTIKKLVTRQNKFEKDKADDTREAREKKKRSMAENLMEGGKKAFGAVKKTFGKVLEPAKGIFQSIFKFISLFLLGSALMKILDWFGNPANKDKIQSIFRFLKDFWPVIAAGVIALMGPIPTFVAAVALAFGFVPKIIDFVKSIFGLNRDVDKEIKKEEKDYEKSTRGTAFDDTTVTTTTSGPTTAFAEDAQGNEITDLDERKRISDEAREAMPMNKGGEVPGQGDKDTVPAMLTPGEFVLTKEAVNRIGADTLYGMNAAAGGVGKPSQKKTAKKKKMKTSTVGTMMNMGGLKMGGMTNNMSYAGGGQVPVQNYFMGGLVKKVGGLISKTPQARLIKFAVNQARKAAVKPPVAKALKALKNLGGFAGTPPPTPMEGGDDSVNEIPSFSVTAPGGRAKEQTLGIRR